MFALANDNKLVTGSLKDLTIKSELILETGSIIGNIGISPNQRYLTFVERNSLDATILHIYDNESKSYKSSINTGEEIIFNHKISPDSSTLLILTRSKRTLDKLRHESIFVWNLTSMTEISHIDNLKFVLNLEFAPDQKVFYTQTLRRKKIDKSLYVRFDKYSFDGNLLQSFTTKDKVFKPWIKRLGNFFPNSSSINRSKFRVLENDEILLPIFSADKTKLYLLLILNQASSVILDQEFSFENETLIETLSSADDTELVMVLTNNKIWICNLDNITLEKRDLFDYSQFDKKAVSADDIFQVTQKYIILMRQNDQQMIYFDRKVDQVTYVTLPFAPLSYNFVEISYEEYIKQILKLLPAIRGLQQVHRENPSSIAHDIVTLIIENMLKEIKPYPVIEDAKFPKLARFLRINTARGVELKKGPLTRQIKSIIQ